MAEFVQMITNVGIRAFVPKIEISTVEYVLQIPVETVSVGAIQIAALIVIVVIFQCVVVSLNRSLIFHHHFML